MGKQRLDNHLQQIVLNIKYEYEEGRLSAIDLLSSVVQKFPIPVLEGHSQLFFLPLVLQLVNDDSKKCKEAVTNCIYLLLKRLPTEVVQGFFDYVKRWSQSSGIDSLPMQRAAAQLFGIFVEARPDYMKRGTNSSDLVTIISDVIVKNLQYDNDEGWELLYFNIVCIEKINSHLPSSISNNYDIWGSLVKLLAFPHPWVMQASSRVINSHVSNLDPTKMNGSDSFVVKVPGSLFDVARNLCRHLDVDEKHFVETTSVLAIKTISWAFQVMRHYPKICYANESADEPDGSGDEDNAKDPRRWVMSRLSNIAKPKGAQRREFVFKCFAALCASENGDHLVPYLQLMIDPIDRAIREETNNLLSNDGEEHSPLIALPKDVLNLLEEACGTEKFLDAYAEVNRKVREKRDQRKQEIASEAVHDPVSAAKRKIKKQVHEKERRKRRVDDRRNSRGGTKKRRSH
eukprot:scaffold15349_cov200-Alexandrium_tamarense.AAC.2